MRLVLLGGAPGIGKTEATRQVLTVASRGTHLVQWVDVDALWAHQPWRVDDATVSMMRANLRAVIAHAAAARVDTLLVTWVFQDASFHDLVTRLAEDNASEVTTIQLHANENVWRRRFTADPERPTIDEFFLNRYAAAQTTPADHVINTDPRDASATAHEIATRLEL